MLQAGVRRKRSLGWSMDARTRTAAVNPSGRPNGPGRVVDALMEQPLASTVARRRRGRAAWVERLRREGSSRPTMELVHLTRTRLFFLAALTGAAIVAPA